MIRILELIQTPGMAWAMHTLTIAQVNAPSDMVGFSGAALAVVGTLMTTLSGVVLHQTRALDKEREKVLIAQGERLNDRDTIIAEQREAIRALEIRVATKDEQIFRLLGLGERATSALDALAPVASAHLGHR